MTWPRRNLFIVVPEDDEDDENDETVQISAKKLLSKILFEGYKAIKKEARELPVVFWMIPESH